ncbi:MULTISPECIES: CoA-acylating methylmalonate-semialdehyde dehydrogenase [unclassified Sporosarcina]|uniref:CoA-acylating methylmalonate-semialdehyde dehydrogenase n=1 Tax=unclassified Sporosarcina TaxID=2647733 RepID=UPI002040CAAF|nr:MULTISPECIES: CoA-acylating methylmalonate-semialdehyde dehydrogenase [unclassified Sporosarcina]GKV65920.1 methylmalonate semialdehyde dehydrogenase [acylating] 2 [Sporosarcina sp. NCCP-2331]GLB56080.1 methylmalonate semialdehyde dehydrogenase [acylating] 2 [Sporosarcina sp. NCCP-2378]
MADVIKGYKVLKNYINGEWVESETNKMEEVINPATGEVIAKVPISTKEEVNFAVEAANQAFETWKEIDAPKRARILFKFQQLLVQHWDELAKIITTENGKNLVEAKGEVLRGIENVEFASGSPTLLMGDNLPSIATNLESGVYRYPIGVIGAISPFNFPMMVPCWMFPMAIATGNTVVLKPSERTPLTAIRLAELFEEAGLPKGVLNIVHGAHDVVNGLLDNKKVAGISFVGSQPVAEYVYKRGTDNLKRVQALSGAKNHSIVLNDANMDNASTQILNAAFGSAGERCMAASVVTVEESVADDFIALLLSKSNDIVIGNGINDDVFLGPVIREQHKERTIEYINKGVEEGAELVRDGRNDQTTQGEGYFVGPTIFDEVTTEMTIWKDEIFAPVLSIIRVKDLDEAIWVANKSRFANGACIFTKDGGSVRKFRDSIDAGMLGVNIGVPAPMAFFPFSGWKDSFYGDLHANGKDSIEFYTRKKVITTRWI